MPDFTRQLEHATHELTAEVLSIIDQKYGPNSPNHLSYHDAKHTRLVIQAAETLGSLAAEKGTIHRTDRYLLVIAAAFHDIEQDLGSGHNEAASAEQAKKAMTDTGIFSDDDLQQVETGILATRVAYDSGYLYQSATDYFSELLADADLVSLGAEVTQYWDSAMGLFHEWYGDQDSLETRIAFMGQQVTLLSTHKYYTPEAREVFNNQPVNLAFSKEVLASLEIPSL